MEWKKKYLQMTNKGVNNSYNSIQKKNSIQKWSEDLTRHFSK